MSVQDILPLLGVAVEVEELVGWAVGPPGAGILRGGVLAELGRGVPAVWVAGKALHQLEAALAQRRVVEHLVHVVEKLGARARSGFHQIGPLADAVDVVDGGRSAGRLHEGGEPVHDVDQLVVADVAAALQDGGSVDEGGGPGAALPQRDLAAPQRPVAGRLLGGTPVVRGEEQEGVVGQPPLLQRCDDLVHSLVQGSQHAALGPPIAVRDVVAVGVHVPLQGLHGGEGRLDMSELRRHSGIGRLN